MKNLIDGVPRSCRSLDVIARTCVHWSSVWQASRMSDRCCVRKKYRAFKTLWRTTHFLRLLLSSGLYSSHSPYGIEFEPIARAVEARSKPVALLLVVKLRVNAVSLRYRVMSFLGSG